MQALLDGEPPAVSALNTLTHSYRIVAFVLHDPDVNTEFHQVMRERFSALHRITGRQVLFFVAGLEDRVNDPKMETVRAVINDLAERYSNSGARQQPGNGVPLVADAVGLTGRLPAIVVADATDDDPMRLQWFCTPTDAANVWWQLEGLVAYEAARTEARTSRSYGGPDIQLYVHEAEPLNLGGRERKVTMSGHYLAAASQPQSSRLKRLSTTMTNDLAAASQRLEEVVKAAREKPDEDEVQTVQEVAHEVNMRLRVLTSAPLPRLAFLDADINEESRVNVVTAWYSKQALDAWAPVFAAATGPVGVSAFSQPSYTGPVVELGSAVERELVLSAGQALRAYVGVPFPQAYNRVAPDVPGQPFKLRVTGADGRSKSVKLNNAQHSGDLWLPPQIGELRSAFHSTAGPDGEALTTWTSPLSMERFIEEWDAMSKIRNDAAHANRPITGADFDCLLEKMNHLKIRGDLDWIVSTKRHLQDAMFAKVQLWKS
ncbi:hypothetical protein E7T06_08825 [Deinococcus sp. Arct2-2]|uniref:hypothetical protein n=1 Tax=Deinococcus sp. Arct2-2 TaxID=2568653 RepID=UPI0010A3EE19|nr:hypothetical protein [Deinococcus sp. Arct2-2]THF70143.1 hypothetical protein E7T06_08825 [Deinococcus sp. Arct2-2]